MIGSAMHLQTLVLSGLKANRLRRMTRNYSSVMFPLLQKRLITTRCYSHPATRNVSPWDSCFIRKQVDRSLSFSPPDDRTRLSRFWAPSGGIAITADEDAHSKLLRAGFLRQAHSGIFHMLPFGLRVQKKVENLIDRHMKNLNASKLYLSSISSEDLWMRSGRLNKVNSELFQFVDRKGTGYLLSPTHEEEITSLVGSSVKSYKELPIRLYQISRKYRDELRPRYGLLRSREFVMKDLYTFDYNTDLALETYDQIRKEYTAIFDELKISYLVADADSGDIGGDLSHEYHFPTSQGEDHIISCGNCDYVANEELAQSSKPLPLFKEGVQWRFLFSDHTKSPSNLCQGPDRIFSVWRGVSHDRSALVNVWYPLDSVLVDTSRAPTSPPEINTHAVKSVFPNLDSGVENPSHLWISYLKNFKTEGSKGSAPPIRPSIVNLVDYRLPLRVSDMIASEDPILPLWPEGTADTIRGFSSCVVSGQGVANEPLNLLRIRNGDACPRCGEGRLQVQRAIELGHTFFLGTRYSDPLNATVTVPEDVMGMTNAAVSVDAENIGQKQGSLAKVPMQMGCHGIGVSRMIGAVAEMLADKRGLNWPRVIAPFEIVVIPARGFESDGVVVYDALVAELSSIEGVTTSGSEVVLDDRDYPFAWKMNDADLIGYPVIVVVGRGWTKEQSCEVQSRRLGIKENVRFNTLSTYLDHLLTKL